MKLAGKSIIVTGAAAGFGAAMCRLFAAEGAKVLVADISKIGAEAVAAEIGTRVVAMQADVTKRADHAAMVARAIEAFGDLHAVVNNAGIVQHNMPADEVTEAVFDRIFDVNVKSIYYSVQAVVPFFRRRGGGMMVNIGSTGGIRPRPGLAWYNASKGAVHLASQSLAIELAPDNIRVNAICPALGTTAMLEPVMGRPDSAEARAKFTASIPLGRLCDPADVAQAACFLISDEARFMTGVCLPVDGGRTI
jgi:3-oxoacyl-[acyl-carrier protein] reductase